jgi:hypothetical protein
VPTLNWIGKEAVVKRHKDVPVRLLEPVPELSAATPAAEEFECEYKGGNQWASAADDRIIGGLWAELSSGRCRFVMATDKRWDSIDSVLG